MHNQVFQEQNDASLYTETVATITNEQELTSSSLVLSAVGISHRIVTAPDAHFLLVSQENMAAASYQLQRYADENRNWPPKPDSADKTYEPFLAPPTLLLIGTLILFFSVTGPWSNESIWFVQGAGDAEKILENHEYYRLLTALTLHADMVHVLGNCLFGGFLFHFFCRLTGNGLGFFAIIATAVLANYINVLVHGSNHHFVGFSTAVFAIIGMLAMFGKRNEVNKRYIRIVPLMAGTALLAMLGSSGERTDLGAHLFGLGCGFVSGWCLGRPLLLKWRRSIWLQSVLFMLCCFTIILSWKLALA